MTLSDRILSSLGRSPKTFGRLFGDFEGMRKQSVSIALNRLLKAGRIKHDGKHPRTWSLPEQPEPQA